MTNPMAVVNQAALDALTNYDSQLVVVQLRSLPSIEHLSLFLTWWTLLLEVAVAVAFLWPTDRWISRYRDGVLIIFILTTYAVAPVIGFGWLLAVMGFAQCAEQNRLARMMYLVAFVVLQVYRLPWAAVLPLR